MYTKAATLTIHIHEVSGRGAIIITQLRINEHTLHSAVHFGHIYSNDPFMSIGILSYSLAPQFLQNRAFAPPM
jgi:hypothetical protein